ncbi:MAG: hypothetical protein LQ345_001211 [Seirophora villosa]|nr:MAG: hypothetical protein LQ345_001211 [Seirophora villosa]
MNVSATLNFLRLIARPSLCLPHTTIPNFNDLPVPLSDAFGPLKPDIRAVVLDKDNCFAVPKENVVYKPYATLPEESLQEKFHSLLTAYPTPHLLIVSNSAGTTASDPASTHARLLSANTGIPVLHHSTKKPGCGPQILAHFRNAPGSRVTAASQIAVVGDRLFTDVMTANLMGSWAVWVRDGVVGSRNPFLAWERKLPGRLERYGFKALMPASNS